VDPLTETSPLIEQRLLPNTLNQATKEKRIHTGENGTHMAHIVQYLLNVTSANLPLAGYDAAIVEIARLELLDVELR
jgi:hypothetical protein